MAPKTTKHPDPAHQKEFGYCRPYCQECDAKNCESGTCGSCPSCLHKKKEG